MIDFLARYESQILYLFLPIEMLLVFFSWLYIKILIFLFVNFRRPKRIKGKNKVHLFSVCPVNLIKHYGQDLNRRAQVRKENQLKEIAVGKSGERESDIVIDLPVALRGDVK